MTNQLPEITIKAVILAVILAVVLAAANAYLGLKVGLTVSASIPAAILSMGILRFFKHANILENNIVQTGASAGEALVAGVAFTLPALLILHYWHQFYYWQTVLITLVGGTIGLIFSVPLRRVLLNDQTLRFPEGTAIGQVLKAGEQGKGDLSQLIYGGVIGGLISLFQSGFKLISDELFLWFNGKGVIYGLGLGFDPALLAAGYIVGIGVALSTFFGVVLGWLIGIPIASYIHGPFSNTLDSIGAATLLWRQYIQPIGVGTMLFGGLWTILLMLKPIANGLASSFASLRVIREGGYHQLPKHERDLPINYAFGILLLLLIPLVWMLLHFIRQTVLSESTVVCFVALGFITVFILIASFFFSSLCGYFAGLIGSSQSPISSVSLSVLLLISLMLLMFLRFVPQFTGQAAQLLAIEGFSIILGAIVSSACVISNDTIQDLKAGQIVGATPWKQQVVLLLGIVASALVLPKILELLFNAYGIAGISPPGRTINPQQMLSAPQAMLMANLVSGAFRHNLPWTLIGIGAIIAIICIVVDYYLKPRGLRLLVLAVGVGIYLPIDTSMALVLGGVASYFAQCTLNRRYKKSEIINTAKQKGLTLACGLVAGSCLMGVFLAIPFTIAQSTEILNLAPHGFQSFASLLGVLSMFTILVWMYRCSSKV